ncbi:GAF domain-containing protein [Pontibacillus litoralis]|uniref:GAF domain-containing protein n=1 Tax=Pontibacillus litoralis JSM 072002 TaxID=1385512 RepID=A0A0A5GAU0_9BACI|nr:GAF domain-containing protein [Pontibacillus litoralis]KGX89134.1 hypothetical protein N784_02065 [Pontibacillus litoralis JSM 072002]
MFHVDTYNGTKEQQYEQVLTQLEALLTGEEDQIANLANAAALLHFFLAEVNWVGFYIWKEEQLVLGPFQGLPACVRIPKGKGVCGTAIEKRETMRIANVHEFPGHIACDANSQSEIVIPMYKDKLIFGVLDIDSPITNRFDEVDERYLKQFADIVQSHL